MFRKDARFNFLSIFVIAAVLASLVSIAPSLQAYAACGTTYTVQSGDTLVGIAQACGTTLGALLQANPDITDPNLIYPGQPIAIPANGIPVTGVQPAINIQPISGPANTSVTVNGMNFPANATITVDLGVFGSVPQFNTEVTSASDGTFSTDLGIPAGATAGTTWIYRASTITSSGSTLTASEQFVVTPVLSGNVYTVQPGDTLSGIAVAFNTTVAALLQANPSITDASLIYTGQQIVIPSVSIIPNTGAAVYTVQSGDTLSGIAAAFNTTVAALLQANPSITDASLIYPGEQIVLPSTSIIPITGAGVYTVKSGDTLWGIAQGYGITLSALEAANPQISDPGLIYPGEQVVIP